MEPLAPATLAGLTPRDRDTEIGSTTIAGEHPFDEPTDLVRSAWKRHGQAVTRLRQSSAGVVCRSSWADSIHRCAG
jgi:hypothetical protein